MISRLTSKAVRPLPSLGPVRRLISMLAIAMAVLLVGSVGAGAESAEGGERAGEYRRPSQSRFGRMFPGLLAYSASDEALFDLVQTQLDPGEAELDNEDVPAGFTYFGQFIDHDLTLNLDPLPAAAVDPTVLMNFRTARFDLDSVYGAGPEESPELYDGPMLKMQEENENGVPDLYRDEMGHAIIGDERNDENLIIAQFHLAVVSFHNELVEEGYTFPEARRLTQWHYQWLVVNDYLPHVVGQDRVDRFLSGTKVRHEFYKPLSPQRPMSPIEFSTAIFRYVHSQVRNAYEVNDESEDEPIPVFYATEPDLRGGRNIPEGLQIDWREFFAIQGSEEEFEGNLSRRLDTKISEALYNLPISGAGLPTGGSNVLAFRNLIRAKHYGLPSGQDVARRMGIEPISNEELGLGPEFGGEAPLWYYMLAESELREDGERLGDVGARIVAEIFLRQLAIDKDSYLKAKPRFTPSVEHTGRFDVGEFLKFAGVVGEEEESAES